MPSKTNSSSLLRCHSGYSLDGSPDVNKSFTTTCGVAASGSMAFYPTLGSSASTTCHKVTCGIPLLASFGTASVGSEVSFHDVVQHSGEKGHRDWLGRGKRRFSGRVAKTVAVVRAAHRCGEGVDDHASLERQRSRGGGVDGAARNVPILHPAPRVHGAHSS